MCVYIYIQRERARERDARTQMYKREGDTLYQNGSQKLQAGPGSEDDPQPVMLRYEDLAVWGAAAWCVVVYIPLCFFGVVLGFFCFGGMFCTLALACL